MPLGLVPSLLTQLHRNLHVPVSDSLRTLFWDAFCVGFFVAGLLALIGAVLVATGRQWFLSLYFGINLAMIVVTPWQNQFWRYLAPVTPLTLIFLFVTLIAIRQWLRRPTIEMGIWHRRAGDERSDCGNVAGPDQYRDASVPNHGADKLL